MNPVFCLFVLLLSLLTLPTVAFGGEDDDDGTKQRFAVSAPAPIILMSIGKTDSKRPFSVSPEEYRETDTPYYTQKICGDQAEEARVNLQKSIRVKTLGDHKYQIRGRVDRIETFRMEEESLTVPGTLFLQMCQVYIPTVVTKRKTWTIDSVNGTIDFKSTLNGESLTVKTF